MAPAARPALELSVLVPVYNEAESLPTLYEEINNACKGVVETYEIIFVNDGSTDESTAVMDKFADEDERVTVIHLRRNFGKSPALAAGFERARGAVIITMDADLQDDPAMIPAFLEKIKGGADLVSGWKQRRHDPLDKTLPSRLFNAVVRKTSGVTLHDFNCGFKAYRSECVRELRVYGGFHRFLPVFADDRGFKVEELIVNHRARVHGHSKFGKKRLVEGLLDLPTVLILTRWRTRPLHFFGIPGALLSSSGLLMLTYLTVLWFLGHPIGTRPLLALGVLLFITGVQILCVGLVAELLVRGTLNRGDVFNVREVSAGARRKRWKERRAQAAQR
jgi:glycosyltransferase involved in cell wall biosynthesis